MKIRWYHWALLIAAIVLGAAVVIAPQYFGPSATKMSFYVYATPSQNGVTLELSPLLDLNGYLPQTMNVEILGSDGSLQATIPLARMTLPKVDVSGPVHLADVRITADNTTWTCQQGETQSVFTSYGYEVKAWYDCTKNITNHLAPTEKPFTMTGCNALKGPDGTLWFDDSHQGVPYVISDTQQYVSQPEFFAYFGAVCVQGYPRVVLGLADVNCVDQKIKWETDGGWSCDLPGGGWTFKAGGGFLWPRGKPNGYIDPRPIVPAFPTLVPDNSGQSG